MACNTFNQSAALSIISNIAIPGLRALNFLYLAGKIARLSRNKNVQQR